MIGHFAFRFLSVRRLNFIHHIKGIVSRKLFLTYMMYNMLKNIMNMVLGLTNVYLGFKVSFLFLFRTSRQWKYVAQYKTRQWKMVTRYKTRQWKMVTRFNLSKVLASVEAPGIWKIILFLKEKRLKAAVVKLPKYTK